MPQQSPGDAVTTARRPALTLALALALQGVRLGAQAPQACLDTLSESAMRRVAVYLVPELHRDAPWLPDNTPAYFKESAGLLAQDAAERVRVALGDSAGALPNGEPRLTWRALDGQLRVVLHRDGRVRIADTLGADPRRAALKLVAQAVEQIGAAPSPQPWPSGVGADSLPLVLRLVHPTFDRAGRITTPFERPLVIVFSVLHPWTEEVRPLRVVLPHYPPSARDNSAEGRVIMRFAVDSQGRADPTTIEESWPAGVPRPSGAEGRYYRDFVAAVRKSIVASTYEPARIGGCPVRQQVIQPMQFDLRR